jgi:hypothetical protein
MIVQVKVIPGAKKTVVQDEGTRLKVYLTAPPVEGKANEALVECLAAYFAVKKRRVTIIKGLKSKHKTINIED